MSNKNKLITPGEFLAPIKQFMAELKQTHPEYKIGVGLKDSYDYESDLKYSCEIRESHNEVRQWQTAQPLEKARKGLTKADQKV